MALAALVLSNQVRYNLLSRKPEKSLPPRAINAGRLLIAYSPLAQGVLGGRYTAANAPGGVRAANLLFSEENLRRADPVIQALRELAAAHQATPAQIALAWVVHHPNMVAIPGARNVAQLEANAAVADITLALDELAHLNQASDRSSPPGPPARQRSPASASRTWSTWPVPGKAWAEPWSQAEVGRRCFKASGKRGTRPSSARRPCRPRPGAPGTARQVLGGEGDRHGAATTGLPARSSRAGTEPEAPRGGGDGHRGQLQPRGRQLGHGGRSASSPSRSSPAAGSSSSSSSGSAISALGHLTRCCLPVEQRPSGRPAR